MGTSEPPTEHDIDTFHTMGQAQAERVGVTVADALAERVERADGGFRIASQEEAHTADQVVAAAAYGVSYLEEVIGEHCLSDGDETWLDLELAGERGSTPIDRLWLAAATAGVESQIAVLVGHGARGGLDAVTDNRHEGEEWLETAVGWHVEAAPDDRDAAEVERAARELAEQQQNQQIDAKEIRRRTARSHRRLLRHLDDELVPKRARAIRAETDRTTTGAGG